MMKRGHRVRKLLVFVSAIIVMLSAVVYNNVNNIMKAETTIDDSPSGERIVDIDAVYNQSPSVLLYVAVTEGGQVYSWNNTSEDIYKPKKIVNSADATDGDKYISDIIAAYALPQAGGYGVVGNNYNLILEKRDGTLYGIGDNGNNILGISGSYNKPVKIDFNGNLKKVISMTIGTSYFLTEEGDVYVTGRCESAPYCGVASAKGTVLPGFTKVEQDSENTSLPKIIDIVYSSPSDYPNSNLYMLSEGGGVYKLSKTGEFQQLRNDSGDFMLGIKEIYSFGDRVSPQILAKDANGNWFSANDYVFIPTVPNDILKNMQAYDDSSTAHLVVSNDGHIYNSSQNYAQYLEGVFYTGGVINVKEIYGDIFAGSATYATILSKEGAVYVYGRKVTFGEIALSAKKTIDNTMYKSSEKYNSSIDLSVAGSESVTINEIRYRMTDHTNSDNSFIAETQAKSSYVIDIEEDKRIHQTYDFFVISQEKETKTSFTVDLYKKAFSLSDVEDGKEYGNGKTITLPANNGFAENTVSATLAKDGGTPVAYASGTAINDAGSYVITATDLYGNNCTYSFSIVDVPVPEGVTFTKGSGELTYGDAITKTNGIIGSLTLEYADGMPTSTVKTLTLGTGGNESNFEVANTNQLKVKGSDLTAQEYTVNVSGTDQNDMAFTGQVKFTIAKGIQTMDFDSATKAFSSGKKMGDVFTLGTQNVLGSASVTYSADSCATISSNQATITCVPASGKITFTATAAATTNYTTKSVTLDIPVSKLDVTIKTQLLESGTYKDSTKIKVGDALPNAKVTTVSPSGFDPTKLGTPTFTYKKAGVTVTDPQKAAGTYDVDVSFSNSTGYTVTITKGTLVVEDIVLDDSNKGDYYTLTSGGKAYTPGTWTKDPIIITPKHANFNKMQVDSGSVTTSAYTYQAEGSKDVTLSFENIDNIKITTTVKLNYDKTAPTMNDFTYEKPKSKLRAAFDHFFGEQKTVVFDATDAGSGVKTYDYEIYELDSDGNKDTSTKQTGQGTSYTLSINKAYEINAKATDNAGNVSTLKTERVTLSDNVGKLDITAKSDGKTYDGTTWTSKAIDLTLKGTNVSGVVKYQYSDDGVVFQDITGDTISLPSPLASLNNKTYTFRAINNDGSSNDETFSMKVDMEKPVISVKGKVSGEDYDGTEVSEDVEIIPSQTKASISGITYYYTKDESIKDSNPVTTTGWTKQSGTILESTNGTHTYYVKGVSGAGLVSDVQSLTIKLLKRNYTTVNVAVTSEGKPYTPDTWAKGDVTFKLSGGISDSSMITGYEYAVTTGAKPTATSTWKPVTGATLTLNENIKGQTYYFRVLPKDNLGSVSKGTIVKLDVEKPSTPTITMKVLNSDPIARFVNAMSFGNWMKESVEVTITSTDSISGIDYYKYSETVDGVKTDKVSKTGVITYDKDTKLTIKASAVDKAGNISDDSEEKEVMIDKEPPTILGVKDQGEYKYYYLPRFISVEDKLSGVKTSTIQKNSEAETPFTDEIAVKEIGTYTVKASDNADNEISLIFKLVPLPSLDEIDGTDESKDIIDQVQKELDEIKGKIDETEQKDYEDWIKDATDKWDSLRKKVVEDDEKTSKVEGVGDTTFDPKVELIVDPIEEDRLPVLPRKALYSYDVYLKKGTTVVQPNGSVKVYLPYPDDASPIIYEIDKDGNVREITAVKEGNYVVFTTNALMKYAISNTKQEVVDDGKIPVPGPDGKLDTDDDVVANPSDKEKPVQNPDGTVTVPPGGSVTYPDGTEIETPDGGILNPDGSLTLPDGTVIDPNGKPKDPEKPGDKGEIVVPGPDGDLDTDDDVIAKPNPDGDKPNQNPDGSVTVPPGGSVEYPDGSVVETPDGGTLKPDGSLTLPDGTEYDKDGNKKPKVCNLANGKALNIDTDQDGSPDLNLDIDNDCVADLNIDLNGDKIPDIDIDSDGDGKADINVDTNKDGYADKELMTITLWKPSKNCLYQGFAYDTMSKEDLLKYNKKEDDNQNGGSNNGQGGNISNSDQNQNVLNSANTGDEHDASVFYLLMISSVVIVGFMVKKEKRKNKL